MVWYAFLLVLILFVAKRPLIKFVTENFGPEYLPNGKLYLSVGVIVGLLAGIIGSVFDLMWKEAKTDSDEVVATALGAAIIVVFLATIVNLFRRHKGKGFWFRYFGNAFFFVNAFFVGVLLGTFLAWGGVLILIAVLIYSGIGLNDVKSMFGGSRQSSNWAQRCETCTYLGEGGYCERSVKKIGDPVSSSCSEYTPRV